MIDLSDIGLSAKKSDTATRPRRQAAAPTFDYEPGLEPGTAGAQALWHVWRGQPVVVVDSPPGAGKTTLVAAVVARLVADSDLNIVVASPTVRGAETLAERIAANLGEGQVVLQGQSFKRKIPGVIVGRSNTTKRHVVVRTVASCRMSPPDVDLLVVDEAYQVTFSDLVGAAAGVEQILMVGDPGQIGPVNTVNTAPWGHMTTSPADRAPEGFVHRPDAVRLHLDRTYRLGEETVEAIAPLYDFDFVSARPDAWVDDLPELYGMRLPVSGEPADPAVMRAIAKHAESLVGRETMTHNGMDVLTQRDVAVVASRNEQVAMLSALLRSMNCPRITVGTADSLQGGQWQAVVAVDPLVGAESASTHALALGRLCVMMSRHVAHLTWAASPDYGEVINAAVPEPEVGATHRKVRKLMLGW